MGHSSKHLGLDCPKCMISARTARIDDNLGRGTDGSNPLPSRGESVSLPELLRGSRTPASRAAVRGWLGDRVGRDHRVFQDSAIIDEASAKALLKAELLPPQHKPAHVQIRQQW